MNLGIMPITKKEKVYHKVTRFCKYCGKSFKTSKKGAVCDNCNRQSIPRRKKIPPESLRCKGYTLDGKRCRNKALIFGYCTMHYVPKVLTENK